MQGKAAGSAAICKFGSAAGCYPCPVDYERTGRTLGTAAKVLGRMAAQRLEQASQTSTERPASPPQVSRPKATPKVEAIKTGSKRLGRATLKPLAKAGHVLWLEITGLFFGLFALGFASQVWRVRASWRSGPEHLHFVECAAAMAVFAYFCASSFARARRREKR